MSTRFPKVFAACEAVTQAIDGVLCVQGRPAAAKLAALGWGAWWRHDLSAWFPRWTQLASPALGIGVWDEWQSCPPSGEHMDGDE